MENIPNVNQILIDEIRDLKKDMRLLLSLHGKVNLHDEFDIDGQEEAAKVYKRSVKTLQKRIEEGVLKEKIHYVIDDNGYYSFSKAALISARGLKKSSQAIQLRT